MSDNYRITLELPLGFSEIELKANYRRLARKYHPDMVATSNLTIQEATEKFQEINEAYEKLKEEIERGSIPNASPGLSKSSPSDPGFWTDFISEKEKKSTSEEAIRLIETEFAKTGINSNDLGLIGYFRDWKKVLREGCFTRGDFKRIYNLILDEIERTVIRKKDRDFSPQNHSKEEKTKEDWEKNTKRGFSTKEEADEYARKKHQIEEKSLEDDKEKDNSYTRPTSPISEISSSSSSTSSQENRPIEDPNLNSENNNQVLSNGKKAEVSNNKDNQLTSQNPKTDDNSSYLILPKERQKLKERLEELKGEVASLRNQQQQSSFQKEWLFNQQQVNNQQTKSDFPWKVVIPMGAIILILGVTVLFLLVRNKRKLK